ncbi:DoxX family protein [Roseovarius sp. C7]|uniref:DoxX family protein n=1 Tax=Roseovarius sp. C7 TaxID=3398643 RepID=UPI0039F6CCD9
MIWIGRILTGIFTLFMLVASISPKLIGADVAANSLRDLGWPEGYVLVIGVIELTCLILYLIPRTSTLGAILMTALLGGAMATQIRAENPLFSHILFSLYLGLFMWGGLWLRNAALRRLFPLHKQEMKYGADT